MRCFESRQTFLKFIVIGAAVFLSAAACQHERVNDPNASSWEKVKSGTANGVKATPNSVFAKMPTPLPGLLQLTTVGENFQARFSSDGTKIIYLSRARTQHKQAQVYEMLLTQPNPANAATFVERRLTFHDGDDLSPVYTSDANRFYYASATDELKSESVATEKLMRDYYPQGVKAGEGESQRAPDLLSEIYVQTLSGRDIERLTDTPGFDGEIDVQKADKRIVFTSARDGLPGIYIADASARNAKRLSPVKEADRGARFSPDGKSLVWFRAAPTAPTSESFSKIYLADGDFKKPRELLSALTTTPVAALPPPSASPNPVAITGPAERLIDPTWTPDGKSIVYASTRSGRYFNLYALEIATGCMKRLSNLEIDERQPSVSPDGKQILFTGHYGETQQLYLVDYHPLGECLNSPISTSSPAPEGASVLPTDSPSSSPSPGPTASSNGI